MTDLPSRPHRALADLHERALEEPADAADRGARRFAAWLDAEAPASPYGADVEPAIAIAEIDVPFWRRVSPRSLALTALAVVCAIVVGRASVRRSAVDALGTGPSPQRDIAGPAAGLESDDPCRVAVHAGGAAPLIDDFEDGNELVALLESRNGYWVTITDTDGAGSESVLVPTLLPRAVGDSRYALHFAGERRRGWGASIQLELGPRCYDASAYRGIAFDVLGPGRLYAGVREVDAVPVDRGGLCTDDCYRSHLHAVDAAPVWTHRELVWGELHQRDGEVAANPRRLIGLEFLVRAEDSPYDLWLDNVSFLR